MRWTGIAARAALTVVLLAAATYAEDTVAVVVHPTRTVTMSREEVARIYLKKQRYWSDGEPIVVINRESGCVTRQVFTERVFGGDSAWLVGYWNERYFEGVFPPATLSSGAAVKKFVASERNAIGYIDATDVDESVKVVLPLP
jgi:ABC-type phosphate transport system substrate-binding protein